MKSRLSLITYGDIMQLFDDVDVPSIENEIGHYLQNYGDGEQFRSITVVEEDDDQNLVDVKNEAYKTHNLAFAEECCQRFYLCRIKKAIVLFLKKQKKIKSTLEIFISPREMAEGCAYKILKMVQLSNRLGRPIVIKPAAEIKQGSSKAPAIQKEKLALIDQIQPYGYYVEANFGCSNEIKMSLNQVIETTAEDGKLQRSTMSIMDSSYQTSDPQCKSTHEDAPTPVNSYKSFKSNLVDTIKYCIETGKTVIHDIDEVIYNNYAKPDCICNLAISHRFLMNLGILPYLKDIGDTLVTSLKTRALFGDYKIACLVVTGKFLSNLLQQYNTTYGEFMWTHLEAAIYSALRTKQLKTHLVMEKSIVIEDEVYDYQPLKLEKYRQVFSNYYFIKIVSNQKDDFRVYRDAGNHWVEVTSINEDATCWKNPILPMVENESCRSVCNEKFYFFINPKQTDRVHGDIGE
ncbi:uncharacterized protein ATC70_001720 [Mucor velutinosus]|uniref:Uncharacterized protein n=1 Tax=Mucor velutinosus TaxID=708070 RepID=A0AAN7DJX4_9FUNG|nr:hypothetical protein ATC70_001720 [Mucor velutinosus]